MRCFIGFNPDSNSIQSLLEFQKKLEKISNEWKFTPKEKIHLTFFFLGNNVSQKDLFKIEQKIQKISSLFKPFEAEAVGFGAFPKEKFARVLWCGLKSEKLFLLANEIKKEMKSLSFEDSKAFNPHITIARSNTPRDVSFLVREYKDIVWNEKNCLINHISIFESVPGSGGYIYKIIKKFEMV